jgi:hypothetical protein
VTPAELLRVNNSADLDLQTSLTARIERKSLFPKLTNRTGPPPEKETAALAGSKSGGKGHNASRYSRTYRRHHRASTWHKLGDISPEMLRRRFGAVR